MQFHYIFIRIPPDQNNTPKTYSISLLKDSLIQVSAYLANVRSKSGSAITYPHIFSICRAKWKCRI